MPIYLDDKKLVKRLLAGDEQAFNQFFDENFGRLYRFALARTSHDEDATREIVQAAMSQALRKIHRYRGESALFTWLCAITRNGIVDWMPGLLCCACFMLTIDAFAQTESSSYRGRPVHEVLEEFREGGMALVYSTNLVTDSLTMLEEPVSSDAVQVVIKILEPHGLTLNEVDGVYLVVRQEVRPGVEGRGTVLVIISNIDSLSTGGMVAIDSTPALPGVEMLSAGVYEFSNVTPGTYEIEIATAGYSSVRETFEIEAYQSRVLRVQMELGPAELEILNITASRYILFSNSQFFIDQRAIQAQPDLGEDPIRSVHRLPGAAASTMKPPSS